MLTPPPPYPERLMEIFCMKMRVNLNDQNERKKEDARDGGERAED